MFFRLGLKVVEGATKPMSTRLEKMENLWITL